MTVLVQNNIRHGWNFNYSPQYVNRDLQIYLGWVELMGGNVQADALALLTVERHAQCRRTSQLELQWQAGDY